jgi:5'-AMP-activated protein kinase, catalytic alpha subunit
VDIWSSGIILFAMVCGYLPFEDANTAELYKKILSGEYQLPDFVSEEFEDLIEKILNVDPAKRYRLSEIYDHAWCKLAEGVPLKAGLIIGYHLVPVDRGILEQLREYGHEVDYAARCI